VAFKNNSWLCFSRSYLGTDGSNNLHCCCGQRFYSNKHWTSSTSHSTFLKRWFESPPDQCHKRGKRKAEEPNEVAKTVAAAYYVIFSQFNETLQRLADALHNERDDCNFVDGSAESLTTKVLLWNIFDAASNQITVHRSTVILTLPSKDRQEIETQALARIQSQESSLHNFCSCSQVALCKKRKYVHVDSVIDQCRFLIKDTVEFDSYISVNVQNKKLRSEKEEKPSRKSLERNKVQLLHESCWRRVWKT